MARIKLQKHYKTEAMSRPKSLRSFSDAHDAYNHYLKKMREFLDVGMRSYGAFEGRSNVNWGDVGDIADATSLLFDAVSVLANNSGLDKIAK